MFRFVTLLFPFSFHSGMSCFFRRDSHFVPIDCISFRLFVFPFRFVANMDDSFCPAADRRRRGDPSSVQRTRHHHRRGNDGKKNYAAARQPQPQLQPAGQQRGPRGRSRGVVRRPPIPLLRARLDHLEERVATTASTAPPHESRHGQHLNGNAELLLRHRAETVGQGLQRRRLHG